MRGKEGEGRWFDKSSCSRLTTRVYQRCWSHAAIDNDVPPDQDLWVNMAGGGPAAEEVQGALCGRARHGDIPLPAPVGRGKAAGQPAGQPRDVRAPPARPGLPHARAAVRLGFWGRLTLLCGAHSGMVRICACLGAPCRDGDGSCCQEAVLKCAVSRACWPCACCCSLSGLCNVSLV